MTSRELRIELHKNYYNETNLTSIANEIMNELNCTGSFTVNAALTQIEFHLDTSFPSQLNFDFAITRALNNFITHIQLNQYEGPFMNMYNILISHVEGNSSTVIIML